MNSAHSETTNSTMNIQNETKPRRWALKFCHRRRLSGDTARRCRSGGTTSPNGVCVAVSGTSTAVRSSTSYLAGLEVDARIDQGIGEIGNQIYHQPDKRKNVKCGEYH